MKVDVSFFGPLVEITNTSLLSVSGVRSTGELMDRLKSDYPLLADRKVMIAVDNRVIREEVPLYDGSKISLLPPFSGG